MLLMVDVFQCSSDWLLTGIGFPPKAKNSPAAVFEQAQPIYKGKEYPYSFGDAVEDLREIWNSGDDVIMRAIEANLKSFRAAVCTRKQITELRDENKTIKSQLFKIADRLNQHIPERKKIGEILIDEHDVSREEIIKALEDQKINNKKIGEILMEKGLISKQALEDAVIRQAKDSAIKRDK